MFGSVFLKVYEFLHEIQWVHGQVLVTEKLLSFSWADQWLLDYGFILTWEIVIYKIYKMWPPTDSSFQMFAK